MLMTASPTADAARFFDAREAAGDALDAQQAAQERSLSSAFIDAASWGADEPLAGSDVAEALYEVGCAQPELLNALFYWAARQSDPVVRAMVAEIGDEWAALKLKELTRTRSPEAIRKLLDKHPAPAFGSADAI